MIDWYLEVWRESWFFGALFTVLGLFLGAIAIGIIGCIVEEIRWSRQEAFKWPAKLVSMQSIGSTLQSTPVTTVGSNGQVGVGVVTTGHGEQHLTVWDCGKYGRISVDDETIFRWAKDKSELWLKELDDEVRVVGIEK